MTCEAQEQLTLGELISALEKTDQTKGVFFEFAHCRPTDFDSYRGYYDHLALGFTGEYGGKSLSVSDLLAKAKAANGGEFSGWKGGDYIMDESTPLWAANPGCTSDTAIVGVKDAGWAVLLVTAYQD